MPTHTHGLVAIVTPIIDKVEVIHFCGYDHEPTIEDAATLQHQLATNPLYDLCDRNDYAIKVATPEMVKFYTTHHLNN